MGSLSNSSPIFIAEELAWITSIGKWRTWVKALNCWRWKIKRLFRSTRSNSAVCLWQSCTNSLPAVHPKLLCAPPHCSISQTHLETNTHTQKTLAGILCTHWIVFSKCHMEYDLQKDCFWQPKQRWQCYPDLSTLPLFPGFSCISPFSPALLPLKFFPINLPYV